MLALASVDTTTALTRIATAGSPPDSTASTPNPIAAVLISTALTALDPLALDAVISTANAFAAGRPPGTDSQIHSELLDGLADTLAKGQGAYFISYQAPGGGGIATSVTPADFAALVAGKDGGSYNGVSIGAAVRQALLDAANPHQTIAFADPAAVRQQTALTLITHIPRSGTAVAKPDKAASATNQLRLLIDKQPGPNGQGTATVTIAYIPPSDTLLTDTRLAGVNPNSAALDVVA